MEQTQYQKQNPVEEPFILAFKKIRPPTNSKSDLTTFDFCAFFFFRSFFRRAFDFLTTDLDFVSGATWAINCTGVWLLTDVMQAITKKATNQ